MGRGEGRQGAGGIEKGPEETFGGDRNVQYLDCSTVIYLKVTKLYTLNILCVNYMQ